MITQDTRNKLDALVVKYALQSGWAYLVTGMLLGSDYTEEQILLYIEQCGVLSELGLRGMGSLTFLAQPTSGG